MTDRRRFLGSVVSGLLAVSYSVRAQPPVKARRIGFLRVGGSSIAYVFWGFMRELGWNEGQNFTLEARYAADEEQLPALAVELVRLNVDMIVTNGTPATKAAMQATKTIPIVFFLSADPVQNGVVTSLARPGGNVTGFTYGLYGAKMLEKLKMGLPGTSRVAVPHNGENSTLSRAGRGLGVKIIDLPLRDPNEIGAFFVGAQKARADAVLVPDVPWFGTVYPRFAQEAIRARLPSIGPDDEYANAGGLMSYGPAPQHWKALVPKIDQILKGANPGEMPVELPTRFELVINTGTAKTLNVTLSPSLRELADRKIE